MKVTLADLRRQVEHLSKLQHRPTTLFCEDKTIPRKMNVGFLRLDFAACYGGYDLCEITSETGAEHSLIGNTFGGTGRLTRKEMYRWLDGAIWAVENRYTTNAVLDKALDVASQRNS